jgi:hypothetical protein
MRFGFELFRHFVLLCFGHEADSQSTHWLLQFFGLSGVVGMFSSAWGSTFGRQCNPFNKINQHKINKMLTVVGYWTTSNTQLRICKLCKVSMAFVPSHVSTSVGWFSGFFKTHHQVWVHKACPGFLIYF